MSCYSCLTDFSIFTKELSCPGCGLSFCSNCLKQKANFGEEEKNVCQNCYKKLASTSVKTSDQDFETPDVLLKRLERLENPAKPPITIFRHSARLTNLKYGLSSEDKKILERLEKLKADHTVSSLPDENEITRRLALLQDKSVESMSKPQRVESVTKSEQEQVDELLKQYMEETDIEGNYETSSNKTTEEIEERLKKLHTFGSTSERVNLPDQSMDDGDSETARIIKRAIAEGQLERRLEEMRGKDEESDISDLDDDADENDSDLPWCIICNEDAQVKCFGCDGSLYCNTCFKQGHEFFDHITDHKYVSFNK